MPCDYKKYPPGWLKVIRPRILARAGEVREGGKVIKEACCEWRGIENRLEGWRFPSGAFLTVEDFASAYIRHEDERVMMKVTKKKPFKICLTIAHLDHDRHNFKVTDDRLAALCQRCHLNHDRQNHKARQAFNRMRKRGQLTLF